METGLSERPWRLLDREGEVLIQVLDQVAKSDLARLQTLLLDRS